MNLRTIFPLCGNFLHATIEMTDDDHNILASSIPNQRSQVLMDTINGLMLEEEFQHVKQIRGVFEYAATNPDEVDLCYNIFIDTVYYGRVVACFPKNTFLSGPATLLAEIGELLTEFYQQHPPNDTYCINNEDFNHVLAMLLAGDQIDKTIGQHVLKQRRWEVEHCYLVVCFGFLHAVPVNYYCVQIEQQFPDCHVAILEDNVYCIINFSVVETAEQDLWRLLPVFLRESLCKAGISGVCDNVYRLYDYRREADAALRLGKQKQQPFWYYRFSDYIMEYIAEAATANLPPRNLCHPAIEELRRYDQRNHSELTESLGQYLFHNCNTSHTAMALSIHRTTMLYRIEKIHQLTRVNLDDPMVRLHLELSFFSDG